MWLTVEEMEVSKENIASVLVMNMLDLDPSRIRYGHSSILRQVALCSGPRDDGASLGPLLCPQPRHQPVDADVVPVPGAVLRPHGLCVDILLTDSHQRLDLLNNISHEVQTLKHDRVTNHLHIVTETRP